MAASFPKYVFLKSRCNGKYLRYVDEEGKAQGFLQFTGEDRTSPLLKFEVELGKNDSRRVHLKSCYNNKYLVAQSETSHWIVAEADKPNEDQSEWSCTLLQPVPFPGDGDGHDFRFRHVKTGNYAVLMRESAEDVFNNCLFAGWSDPNKDLCDVVTVI